MRVWAWYAGVALAVVVVVAAVATALTEPGAVSAVWTGAAAAYLIQLVAFAGLVKVRGRPERFVVAWGGGTLLRFGLVAVLGFWVTRAPSVQLAPAPLLLSAAGFVVLLALLEPVFLHRGTSRT